MIAQTTFKGYTITVDYDDEPNSPLEYSTLGMILCWTSPSLMTLGHYHVYPKPKDFLDAFDPKEIVMLPVYLYWGRCVMVSTDPKDFKDLEPKGWEWGQVGYVYATKDKISAVYGWKSLSAERRREVEAALREEVSIYNQYISGDVYQYKIADPDGYIAGSSGELYYTSPDVVVKHAKAWITQTIAREKLDVII